MKTLKDTIESQGMHWECFLEGEYESDGTLQLVKFRQSAIEGIKELMEELETHKSHAHGWPPEKPDDCKYWVEMDDYYYSFCNARQIIRAKIDLIKHIFNITEKELE